MVGRIRVLEGENLTYFPLKGIKGEVTKLNTEGNRNGFYL
jgi:hypothetical protein